MDAIPVQLATAAATAVWAVALRGVSVDTQLAAFAVAGAMAAIALCLRAPQGVAVRPIATVALILMTYQSLLYVCFASLASCRRAQVVVNLNFILIFAYDSLIGTDTATASAVVGGVVVIVASLCIAAGTPPGLPDD